MEPMYLVFELTNRNTKAWGHYQAPQEIKNFFIKASDYSNVISYNEKILPFNCSVTYLSGV